MNIEITGSPTSPVTNVRIRRNYIFGACGGGAVVGFDGNDVAAMLFEDNFFDYNGGPSNDCNYVNSTEARTSNINPLAHDVYFADDSVRVVALDVTFRHNAFSRTLQSVKGPYTGTMDDNLFYNYWSGGYIGTWGGAFSNNVLIDGGGFGTALDNNHSPNEIACRTTRFCSNLFYNEGSPYTPDVYAFTAQNAAGVNLVFDNNVIDGLDRAFEFNDSTCFAYDVTDNIVQTNSFYEFYQPWPRASLVRRRSRTIGITLRKVTCPPAQVAMGSSFRGRARSIKTTRRPRHTSTRSTASTDRARSRSTIRSGTSPVTWSRRGSRRRARHRPCSPI